MPIPVIAITNASTCLTDAQVEAVIPALQKQVSDDFKAYWELDCTPKFLSGTEPLTPGWWQIVNVDNPDQAGALGYHEMSSTALRSEKFSPSSTWKVDHPGQQP
jgi:hypothetical protein